MKPAEGFEDHLSRLGIEVAGGFVGQDEGGIVDQGPGDGHPLYLSSGKLIGEMDPVGLLQSRRAEGLLGPRLRAPAGRPLSRPGEGNVTDNGCPRKQVEGLEDKADAGPPDVGEFVVGQLGYVLALEPVPATRGGVERAQNVHEGRFPGAGRTHDRDVLA